MNYAQEGQTGTRGGVAHLLNDIASWVKLLPRTKKDLSKL
jgi:hypothetical protein